jgi:hypothetical protein
MGSAVSPSVGSRVDVETRFVDYMYKVSYISPSPHLPICPSSLKFVDYRTINKIQVSSPYDSNVSTILLFTSFYCISVFTTPAIMQTSRFIPVLAIFVTLAVALTVPQQEERRDVNLEYIAGKIQIPSASQTTRD